MGTNSDAAADDAARVRETRPFERDRSRDFERITSRTFDTRVVAFSS